MKTLMPLTHPARASQVGKISSIRPFGKCKRAVVTSVLVLAVLVFATPAAHAYTYDYNMFIEWEDQDWNTRAVAHNYHYIHMSTQSSIPYICVKLTRTSDGQNYGDAYCNYYATGHHYAGDTGTLSWGKQHNSSVDRPYPYHEEW